MDKKINLGGQAVVEGVLIRSPNFNVVAVRDPKGKIRKKVERFTGLGEKWKFLKWPFIRGLIALYEMLKIGISAINYSANIALEEENESFSWKELVFSLVISLVLVLIFFKYIPFLASQLIFNLIKNVTGSWLLANVIEGILKASIFIAFLAAMLLLKDMRRVFSYHGAEHMTIHAYEAGKRLTVQNVKKFDPKHARCGTSFLILVILISVIVYSFLPRELPFWLSYGYRILLLPVIVGLSYEFLKLSAKNIGTFVFRLLAWPGIMTQYITTRHPDSKQIEIAIASVNEALKAETSAARARKSLHQSSPAFP
ncbi:DUF1385 domain-containing protein [Candidatus Woesearchaeota archaeon]|nr:DUF1385 domain-containing protein [Candidatus Woesearchaeota archaeon]